MAFLPQTERLISLKKLFAKAHTGNTKALPNESIPSQISIDANQIIGQVINSDPAVAVSNGLVEVVEADLVLDATSNGKSYRCHFPSSYSGFFTASAAGNPIGNYTFAVPFFYNNVGVQLDNSGGYKERLFDNGSEIFALDARNWIFDPFASLITSESDLSLGSTGTMYFYVYTGSTVQDHINSSNNPHNVTARQVGGISAWQSGFNYIEGDLVYYDRTSSFGDSNFSNGIYVCTSDHTASVTFDLDQANWKVLNSAFLHNQSTPAVSWQVDHKLGRYPSVSVRNNSNVEIEGEVEHSNTNRLFIRFNSSVSGFAYCT